MISRVTLPAMLLVLFSQGLLAQTRCTLPMLKGVYAVTCSGSFPTPAGFVPYALQATGVGDAAGVFTATASQSRVNLGGSVMPAAVRGQAELNSDCTGFISYAVLGPDGTPTPGRMDFAFVVLDEGKEIRGMLVGFADPFTGNDTGPVPVVQCQLKLMNRRLPADN